MKFGGTNGAGQGLSWHGLQRQLTICLATLSPNWDFIAFNSGRSFSNDRIECSLTDRYRRCDFATHVVQRSAATF